MKTTALYPILLLPILTADSSPMRSESVSIRGEAASAPNPAHPPAIVPDPEKDPLKDALKHEENLRAFLTEHPRWIEEEHGTARLQRLFHRTIDAYLRVVWSANVEQETAVRALWMSHSVCILCGEFSRARDFAEDIVHAHPSSKYFPNAQLFINQSEKPGNITSEEPASRDPSAVHTSTPRQPPSRRKHKP